MKDWTELAWRELEEHRESGRTYELTRTQWPDWMQRSTQMQAGYLYWSPVQPMLSTATTAPIHARLVTVRRDTKDTLPFNVNYYLISLTTDRRAFMSPPFPSENPAHHCAEPPDWLASYSSHVR